MTISWEVEDRDQGPHRGLDPVSAWLLRSNAPEAGRGGADPGAPRHAGIVDFDPDGRLAADRIVIMDADAQGGGTLSQNAVNGVLDALTPTMSDPRLFLLPLHADSLPPNPTATPVRQVNAPRDIAPWLSDDRPPRAIVGVIDHAINIFHHRFQLVAGQETRITYAWMQGGQFDETAGETVPFGREWTRDDINTALQNIGGDDDALLRQLDADFSRTGLHPLALRAAHGTHVLDLAAGMDPDQGMGGDVPIIAVNLPPEVAREPTGSVLSLFFLQAFDYILQRARQIMEEVRAPIPVYINFSFGLSGGMRGGRHLVERAMDRGRDRHQSTPLEDVVGHRPVEVFIPAGNRNMARGHVASIGSPLIETVWQIQPGDPSANHMDIRIEVATPLSTPVLRLSLTRPGTDTAITTEFTSTGQARILRGDAGGELGRALLRSEGAVDDHGVHLFNLSIALAATDPGASEREALPPGGWGVTVEQTGTVPIRMDAWILRDDTPPGYRDNGRQSYFVDAQYREQDETGRLITSDPEGITSGIQRQGTLNAIATAEFPTVVGGVYGQTPDGLATEAPRAVPYSATPLPNRPLTPEVVEFSAPSERSLLRSGVLAAGTRSGSTVALNGTSVAAPQVLRQAWEDTEPAAPPPVEASGARQLGQIVTMGTIRDQIEETGAR